MATVTIQGKAKFVEGGDNKISFQVGEYAGKDIQTGKSLYANYKVTVFGKPVEWLAPKLVNDSQVVITGKLTPKDYVAKDGTPKTALNVMAYDVNVVETKTPVAQAEVVYNSEDLSF